MIAAMAFATKAILAFWGASKAVDKEENGISKTNATTEKLIITPNNKLMPVMIKKIIKRMAGFI